MKTIAYATHAADSPRKRFSLERRAPREDDVVIDMASISA